MDSHAALGGFIRRCALLFILFFTPTKTKRKPVIHMTNELPQDTFMLLSVINTKLRDAYSDLDALCDDLGADKDQIVLSLRSIGYEYDPKLNRFC